MSQPLPLYAEIVKIDEDAHMVFGYASTDKRDHQGEVILKSAMEKAIPNYMVFANIREMHQPSAVGTAKEAVPDDKGLWLGAWIGDDRAWMKVKTGIYKGFSVGGRVTSRDEVDRSIITGIELSEISLVDRPANPDAVFQIVKRADGQLRPEPLQKWDCGIPEHQHTSKSDAGSCMAHELLMRCHDEVVGVGIKSIAEVREELGKVQPNLNSGKFGTHTAAAAENTASADAHAAHAASARKAEAKHRRLSAKAQKKGDAKGVAIHEHLAGASAALATQHDNAAEQHRQLAARHGAVTHKTTVKEINMTTRTVADALKDSTSAVALLASSIEVQKGDAIDHAAEAKAAGVLVETHTKLAAEFEKAASDGRIDAGKAADKDKAPLLVKASEADVMVIHHVSLAKGYADLIAHYAIAGNLGKALVPEVKIASAEDHKKSAAFHTEAAKKATEAKDDNTAKHHTAIAEAYTTLSKAASPTAEQASPAQGPGKGTEGDGNEGDADDARKEKVVDGSDGVDGKTKPGDTAYDDDAGKGGMGQKCSKCGSTMGKGTDKCANCGASMTKVDLDAGGIVTLLKGALENTKDEALKTVLSSALGSLSGGDEAAKAAEIEKKAKEAEIAKQAEITTKIATLTTDCADAVKALDTMTNAVKGMAKDVLALQKQVKGQIGVIDTLRGQVTKLESQPEASRARGSAMSTLRKSDDDGGSDDTRDDFTKRVLAVPAGRERADFLVRHGYTGGKR